MIGYLFIQQLLDHKIPAVNSPTIIWNKIMSKEQRSNREDKKKPALNPKEKKAAKKAKKESKE